MKALFLNSSSSSLQVAFKDNLSFSSFSDKQTLPHSQIIFDAIHSVLNGVKLSELDFIAVVVGPGSFTGIRLALSIVKGFHLALGIRVIPISLFQAIYFSLPLYSSSSPCSFLLDAGADDAFFAKVDENASFSDFSLVKKDFPFVGTLVSDFVSNPNVISPFISPERVLDVLSFNFNPNAFVQAELSPLYIKPHYAKIKKA